MNYKQLEFFLVACEEKSFSKAADKLFISQQGISKSINQLEEELGVPLFDRSHKGLVLTKYGEALRKYAEPFLRQHDYIISQIQGLKMHTQKTLSVGFASGVGDYLPKGFFSDFLIQNPDIECSIRSFGVDDCLQSILDYRLSMGFAAMPIDFDLFDSQYSERQKLYLIVGKDHAFAKRGMVHISELKNETVITLNAKTSPQDHIIEVCKEYGFEPSYYLTGAENNLIFELCTDGGAVSFYAGKKESIPDNLVSIDLDGVLLHWEIHLVTNKNIHLSTADKLFIEYTKKVLG